MWMTCWNCVKACMEERSDQHELLLNTSLFLLEPCLAVILKKVNLEQMVMAAHGSFFVVFFFISLIFFFIFFVRVLQL